ncbi:MAG: protein-glutamate O-methyltransferase CheR [Myxococcales bacterium]|nr:protein-glutamate O-methyltransferase CheR [Myxococcales bacterium]
MTVSQPDIAFLRELVYKRSAIVIEPDKDYLVEARLGPVARDQGYGSIGDLVTKLRGGAHASPELTTRVVEAMTTNETTFFRDTGPFEALEKRILPELIKARAATKTLTIWSAACSTGQEPYSVAMLLDEAFPQLKDWRIRILATDLSTAVLDRAREGKYRQLEVNRGLPARLLVKYMERVGTDWRLKSELRQRVEFRQMNLVEPWSHTGRFDVIFLRNVLIYFDVETKKGILGRMRQTLAPDGFLFLGGAETTLHLDPSYEREQYERATFYRPTAGAKG